LAGPACPAASGAPGRGREAHRGREAELASLRAATADGAREEAAAAAGAHDPGWVAPQVGARMALIEPSVNAGVVFADTGDLKVPQAAVAVRRRNVASHHFSVTAEAIAAAGPTVLNHMQRSGTRAAIPHGRTPGKATVAAQGAPPVAVVRSAGARVGVALAPTTLEATPQPCLPAAPGAPGVIVPPGVRLARLWRGGVRRQRSHARDRRNTPHRLAAFRYRPPPAARTADDKVPADWASVAHGPSPGIMQSRGPAARTKLSGAAWFKADDVEVAVPVGPVEGAPLACPGPRVVVVDDSDACPVTEVNDALVGNAHHVDAHMDAFSVPGEAADVPVTLSAVDLAPLSGDALLVEPSATEAAADARSASATFDIVIPRPPGCGAGVEAADPPRVGVPDAALLAPAGHGVPAGEADGPPHAGPGSQAASGALAARHAQARGGAPAAVPQAPDETGDLPVDAARGASVAHDAQVPPTADSHAVTPAANGRAAKQRKGKTRHGARNDDEAVLLEATRRADGERFRDEILQIAQGVADGRRVELPDDILGALEDGHLDVAMERVRVFAG